MTAAPLAHDPVLAAFATQVGTEGPVAVEGGRTRWAAGGALATDARLVRAPAGIVHHQPEEMIVVVRAPGTGPDAIRALRHRPVVDSPTASSRPCSLSLARKTHVGPLPLTIAPRAP